MQFRSFCALTPPPTAVGRTPLHQRYDRGGLSAFTLTKRTCWVLPLVETPLLPPRSKHGHTFSLKSVKEEMKILHTYHFGGRNCRCKNGKLAFNLQNASSKHDHFFHYCTHAVQLCGCSELFVPWRAIKFLKGGWQNKLFAIFASS